MDIEGVSVELQEETIEQFAKKRRRDKKASRQKFLVILILFILWGSLVYGAYWYIDMRLVQLQQQINGSITDVQETNNLRINELNDKLLLVEEEIQDISRVLEATGKEVTTSGSTAREELNKRMKELDNRLEELRKSLEILKESKGEIN
jgi:hypothetical protein